MNLLRSISVVVALAATTLALAPAHSAGVNDPGGIWLTQAGDAKVRVSRCGSGLCGTVVWLRDPIDSATGRPQTDDKNENASLRRRRVIGISLFIRMKTVAPDKWSGQIYNADDGKTYASTVTLQGPKQLEVQGCVGSLCGSEMWSRSRAR